MKTQKDIAIDRLIQNKNVYIPFPDISKAQAVALWFSCAFIYMDNQYQNKPLQTKY